MLELPPAAIAKRDLFARGLAVASHNLEDAGAVTAAARVGQGFKRFHQARDLIGGGDEGRGLELCHDSF